MTAPQDCLPSGTLLDHYIIVKPISAGGFSVVYLAVDKQTRNKVVIKEYLPKSQAKRLRNNMVVPISSTAEKMLRKGRMLFFQEASTLSNLKHPHIVNVINFFRANGTVYIVMEYNKGRNLEAYIKRHDGMLSKKFLLTVFPPLLEGLKEVHDNGYLHLDIKPGNIHIRPGGIPLLLDFGSVHRRELSRLHQPGHVLTSGYAPIEQYHRTGYVGPWTDLYALGATMRSCITGKPPLSAHSRHEGGTLAPMVQLYKKHYPLELLRVIDWCMELDPELRPQDVSELWEHSPELFPVSAASEPRKLKRSC